MGPRDIARQAEPPLENTEFVGKPVGRILRLRGNILSSLAKTDVVGGWCIRLWRFLQKS